MNKKKRITVFAVAFAATLLLLTGVYAALNTSFLRQKPQNGDGDPASADPQSLAPAKDEAVNFLLCGLDESEQLTDVIMVVSLDVGKKTVNVFQVPRDTYVGIKRYPTGKINAVYGNAPKGQTKIGTLEREIEHLFALEIDHYATVNLSGLRSIVDSMGGVTVEIPQTIYFTDSKVIKKGSRLLDGEKAEWFVRYRAGYSNGDIGRMHAQEIFLKACAEQALSMSKAKMLALLSQNYSSITTDLTLAQVLEYYGSVREINTEDIAFYAPEGYGVMHEGYAVYSLDKEKTAELLNEHFRPYSDSVPAEELNLTELTPN